MDLGAADLSGDIALGAADLSGSSGAAELSLGEPEPTLRAAVGIAVGALGDRFDRILVRNFQRISQIFRIIFANLERLDLGCIEADFYKQILILQH